jgi:uncharacterized membrane protein
MKLVLYLKKQLKFKVATLSKPPSKKTENQPATDAVDQEHDLELEIDRQVGSLIPQKARGEVVKRLTSIMVSETFSGPIAHPRHLREYESILPSSADRIISMAEVRNHHHIEMDQKLSNAEIADRKLGMMIGGGLFAFLIIAALSTALFTENAALTSIFMGTAIIGGIGLFVKGRNG